MSYCFLLFHKIKNIKLYEYTKFNYLDGVCVNSIVNVFPQVEFVVG